MFSKGLLKVTSILLLIAIVGLTVPLQQIFHHHKDQVSYAGKIKSAISEHEQSCCKVTDFFHHAYAIIQSQNFSFFDVSYHYQESFYVDALSAKTYITTNKAPPVA